MPVAVSPTILTVFLYTRNLLVIFLSSIKKVPNEVKLCFIRDDLVVVPPLFIAVMASRILTERFAFFIKERLIVPNRKYQPPITQSLDTEGNSSDILPL
jgi:hypothetical protein